MTRPKESPWNRPVEVSTLFEPCEDGPPRETLQVVWDVDGVEVRAFLERTDGAVDVTAYSVQGGEAGIPARARNLPSTMVTLQAARRFGPKGLAALAHLSRDTDRLSAISEELGVAPKDFFRTEATTTAYARELGRRPLAKQQREISVAAAMLRQQANDPAVRTVDIVSRLCREAGVSEATAFRRIAAARKQIDLEGDQE